MLTAAAATPVAKRNACARAGRPGAGPPPDVLSAVMPLNPPTVDAAAAPGLPSGTDGRAPGRPPSRPPGTAPREAAPRRAPGAPPRRAPGASPGRAPRASARAGHTPVAAPH